MLIASVPSLSQAQQHLFAAAEHGATFPKAKKLRRTMTLAQLREFASTSTKGLPKRVRRDR
jgi:hypothetical protein